MDRSVSAAAAPADADSEEDYMKMTFTEPPTAESSIGKATRARRQRKHKGMPQTKEERRQKEAERKREQEEQRAAALDTAIGESNKGFKMLAKMGYKQGEALGKARDTNEPDTRRKEPIRVSWKGGREGIGMENEKKRKVREEVESHSEASKRLKATEEDFSERLREERENARVVGLLRKAQRTALNLEEMANDTSGSERLADVNVLWRGLVKHRRQIERDQTNRREFHAGLSNIHNQESSDEEDADYKLAIGAETPVVDEEEDLDQNDTELDDFEALEPQERLEKLVMFLRTEHRYCVWCQAQYPDFQTLREECPGLTEDVHP